jgi:pantetheine-phosphate adenylyltransferase
MMVLLITGTLPCDTWLTKIILLLTFFMRTNQRLGVYAGSFDPLTIGHLWMIEQGVGMFDRVIVAVGVNPEKRYTFTLDERLAMLRKSLEQYRNLSVTSFSNRYLIDYAQSVHATHILRGIRSESDYEYERTMRNINGDLDSTICSVFLMPPRDIAEVSSSMVKGLVGPKGWQKVVRKYVPEPVYRRLVKD